MAGRRGGDQFGLTDVARSGVAMQPFTRVTAAAVADRPCRTSTRDRVSPRASCARPERPEYASFPVPRRALHADGSERTEFVLNQPRFAGEDRRRRQNFGLRFLARGGGVGAGRLRRLLVIAPSLGDIFHQNCFKNACCR